MNPDPRSPEFRTRACVIFNPTARGEKAAKLRTALNSLPPHFETRPTRSAGDAVTLAREAAADGFGFVVAAGGDGTVHEVVNGILNPEDPHHTNPVLGVLPLGTMNVFARELGIPMDLRAAVELLKHGHGADCFVPKVHLTSNVGSWTTRRFVQLAGAGLDSIAVEKVNWNLKKRWGAMAYAVAGFQALRHGLPRIHVRTPEKCLVGELVLIGNGRLYGGPVELFPEGRLDDDRLAVTVFPKARLADLATIGLGWALNDPLRFSDAASWLTRSVELSAETKVPLEIEGELAGQLPARFESMPFKIRVVCRNANHRRPED